MKIFKDSRNTDGLPSTGSPSVEAAFEAEILDLEKTYGNRIPLSWRDALQDVIVLIEEEKNNAFH